MLSNKWNVAGRVGRWSAHHPWRAVLIWLVVVAAAFLAGGRFEPRKATDLDLQVGQAAEASRLVEENGLSSPATENILVGPRHGSVTRAVAATAAKLRSQLQRTSGVASVSAPVPSEGGTVLLLRVTMAGDADTAQDRVGPIRDVTARTQAQHPDVIVQETGAASVQAEFQDWLGKDLRKATGISVPITLGILLLIFGALVMAGVPVLLGLSAVAAAMGLWALASRVFPDPGPVADVIVLMGLAVGVDYCLFYLRRYREECANGYGRASAVNIAAATSGHSVLVSGIAVILSMAGVYLAGDLMLSALVTGGILVVAVAMASAITVLPALLVLLGRAVDRPRVPLVWRLGRRGGGPRIWNALLAPATNHPLASLLLAVVALVALALPIQSMSLKATQVADFPRSLSTMQTYDRLMAAFPGSAGTDVVAVRVPAEQAESLPGRLERLVARIQREPLFAHDTKPAIRYSADRRGAVVEAGISAPSGTDEARDSVERLRGTLVPEAMEGLTGAEYAVGGDEAEDMDYSTNLGSTLPWVMLAVFALTFVVILFAFRSVVVALTTVVLNLLSVSASLGILVLVFQGTWAEGLLDFTSTGHVVSWVPVLLFVILSGLSLDYHVFVVSRIREGVIAGMTTRNAVVDGITRTAGVVTGAALIMVAVFATFATLSFIEMKQIGVGLAVAIVLDATVIRIVVLPAAMKLLGRANWWPARTGPVVVGTERKPRRPVTV
ncbi:MMPL family transporter [Streptomyces sp. NPDC059176]|uniref:MMPL family transporter n=1 Tax=unclassified Streptomyces TaxID=2593676 RepID=UPI00368DEE68